MFSSTGKFWTNFNHWHEIYRHNKNVEWKNFWVENEFCKDCRLCCGPQGDDDPFPMALLPDQVGKDNIDNFYLLNEDTAYIGKNGCKSNSSHGCKLPLEKKPIACGLFPIVLVNGRLYLYQQCPAVLFLPLAKFLKLACDAALMLDKLSLEDLRHISLNFNAELLSQKYIDLHIQLFDEHGKNMRLD